MMNHLEQKKLNLVTFILFALLIGHSGCGKSTPDASVGAEDSSTSGSVASAVGGAYNSSSAGTMASLDRQQTINSIDRVLASLSPLPHAQAATSCSTYSQTDLASCLLNGGPLSLTYSACSFGNSTATWNGGVTLSCSGHNTINRRVTNGTTRTNAFGSVITLNTSSLSTYSSSGASISGSGTTLTTASGSTTLAIGGVQLIGSKGGVNFFDHTLTTGGTPLVLNEATKELTGTVTTYHNLVHVTASSNVDVFFTSGCCTPTRGTITTTFTTSNALGAKFNGATESLNFTGCGQATYSGPDGTAGNVSIANCF